jgi:hypothetical protein
MMLTQIVRPMVRTQIRLLANSQATRSTLVNTIAQWLSFLGVHAQVTQLDATSNCIQLSLSVGKPESCDPRDWEQILQNLGHSQSNGVEQSSIATMPLHQQGKLQRLLAYVIQAGSPNASEQWSLFHPELKAMGFDDDMLMGIKAALKVPQSLDLLMEGLDADLAAIALPKAVSIAMLDRQVTSSEDKALSALLEAMKRSAL